MIEFTDRSILKKYGHFLNIDTSEIVSYLTTKSKFPKADENLYVRDEIAFHSIKGINEIHELVYGYSDIEVGYCNGYNHLLNCMEYHTCPEVDIAGSDLILLLALYEDIVDGKLDSTKVKAFYLKKGEAFVLNPYVLHYSPCRINDSGFRCGIILQDKTNMDLMVNPQDKKLFKINKWLLAHKDAVEVKDNAYIGITGINIDVLK